MSVNRRNVFAIGVGAAALATMATNGVASASPRQKVPSDAELAQSLPGGFRSAYAAVNGTRLHYVAGGAGEPLFLLPGWPATWWSYRKIMPTLARHYRVIVPDLRGMGGSEKPPSGFDKMTMARDIYELARTLGYPSVNIAGHDIGAMVAFSFAVNHPQGTRKLALMDVLHPDQSFYEWRLIQPPGGGVNMWWMSFNQVDSLPEQLLTGRARYLIDWHYGIGLIDQSSVEDSARSIFANAYNTPDAIRAGNGWYKAFQQDIADMDTYEKVTVPLLGLASPGAVPWFQATLPNVATDVQKIIEVKNSLHWLHEEDPELIVSSLTDFFG